MAGAAGSQVAFTPLGILVALTFIGLPFVVRTVQPVLEDLPNWKKRPPSRRGPLANLLAGGVSAMLSRRC